MIPLVPPATVRKKLSSGPTLTQTSVPSPVWEPIAVGHVGWVVPVFPDEFVTTSKFWFESKIVQPWGLLEFAVQPTPLNVPRPSFHTHWTDPSDVKMLVPKPGEGHVG